MSEKQPQNYLEWLIHAGETEELGLKILVTKAILKDNHRELVKKLFDPVVSGFERALFDAGLEPTTLTLSGEEDIEHRAKEIAAMIDTQQGASLEQYAGKVFNDAENFYNQVKVWESKSLWQYIKWWLKRHFTQKV